jgi:hypothetical protein
MTFEAPSRTVPLTLCTEQFIMRGAIQTRQHRVTDILNGADQSFLVLEDVSLEEFGSNEMPTTRSSPRPLPSEPLSGAGSCGIRASRWRSCIVV